MAGQYMDGGDGNTSFGKGIVGGDGGDSSDTERRGKSDMDPDTGSIPSATPPPLPSATEDLPDDQYGLEPRDIEVLRNGGVVVGERDGRITLPGKDGKPVTKTKEELEKEIKDVLKGKQDSWLPRVVGGALGGLAGLAVTGSPVGAATGVSTGAAAANKLFGMTEAEKEAAAKAEYDKLLAKYDGDIVKAVAEMNGGAVKTSTYTPPPAPTGGTDQPERTGKSGGEVNGGASGGSVQATAPAQTPEQQAVAAAQQRATDEQKRFDSLVSLYGANRGMLNPLTMDTAASPKEADAVRKVNDLIALSGKSGVVGDKAKADLANLTKMTPENRDAWLQYYNPSAGQASGASASGASATAAQGQATLASMAPTEVGEVSQATGSYQTSLDPLTSYDPTIAQSEERARAVGMADLMEARARGEVPSVAAEQYKAGLDRLLQSQQAAVASQRGPASTLALRGAQTQAGQLGQQAVRETAILRMQEQKEAEQLAANQANLIMIEDQKLSSQQKLNELNQRVQIVSADLQNTRNLLDRDMFNAEAINKVNMLEAQLRTDVEKLNAEMQTNASLTNAEMQTRASIASAANSTQASIASADNATRASIASAQNALTGQMWAGDSAQKALQTQIANERADWAAGYGVQRDVIGDQQQASQSAINALIALQTGDTNAATLQAKIDADNADRAARERAAKSQEQLGWWQAGNNMFNTWLG